MTLKERDKILDRLEISKYNCEAILHYQNSLYKIENRKLWNNICLGIGFAALGFASICALGLVSKFLVIPGLALNFIGIGVASKGIKSFIKTLKYEKKINGLKEVLKSFDEEKEELLDLDIKEENISEDIHFDNKIDVEKEEIIDNSKNEYFNDPLEVINIVYSLNNVKKINEYIKPINNDMISEFDDELEEIAE